MKITIINTSDKQYSKNDFINPDITVINTKLMDLKFCIGCFGCWVKTPGMCVQKDDMPVILQAIINSDLTVYVSEVKVGFVSSELKKVNDKTIPLIHPYMEIVYDEIHHKRRYDTYPEIALVLIEKERISDEVFDISKNCYVRQSYNMRSELKFVIKDNELLRGLNNEISNY